MNEKVDGGEKSMCPNSLDSYRGQMTSFGGLTTTKIRDQSLDL